MPPLVVTNNHRGEGAEGRRGRANQRIESIPVILVKTGDKVGHATSLRRTFVRRLRESDATIPMIFAPKSET